MNPRGTVKTLDEALSERGIDTSTIQEGRTALAWLVDDMGQEVQPEPIRNFIPKVLVTFTRVGTSIDRRFGSEIHYRLNSGLALTPTRTEILWLG